MCLLFTCIINSPEARVLSIDEFHQSLEIIEQHRHPEKNALIVQISFKLGLRVQEVSALHVFGALFLGITINAHPNRELTVRR